MHTFPFFEIFKIYTELPGADMSVSGNCVSIHGISFKEAANNSVSVATQDIFSEKLEIF